MGKQAFAATVIATSLVFSGCSQVRTAMHNSTVKGSSLGALLGAGAGAGLGALGGHAGTGALVGTGAGAVIGGFLGHFMGKQGKELKALEAKTDKLQVEQTKQNELVIRVKDQLLFDTDSSEIKPGAYSVMSEIAQILNKYPDTNVKVYGHTDSTGSDEYNLKLSERRAMAVSNLLQSYGVNPSRVVARGFGESMPIASNTSPEGRSLNRRVEIIVSPQSSSNMK